MNCSTTCNTGSCRRTGQSPGRTPAPRISPCKESRIEDTDQVWTEAGFLPPADYRRAVALLHRLAMDDEPAESLFSSVLAGIRELDETQREYRIFDRAKLRRIGEEYGIELAGRDDAEIAHAVTMAIIGEYGEKAAEEHT